MITGERLGNWLPAWARGKREERDDVEGATRLDLIGLDMAPRRKRERNTALVPIIAAIVLCALGLVWLRMDVVRMRYAAAEAVAEEQALLDRKQTITVELLRLREPTRLAKHAKELGFSTPDRVIPFAILGAAAPDTTGAPRGSRP